MVEPDDPDGQERRQVHDVGGPLLRERLDETVGLNGVCGRTFRSRTRSVIAIAMTPSPNASTRAVGDRRVSVSAGSGLSRGATGRPASEGHLVGLAAEHPPEACFVEDRYLELLGLR